MERASHLPDQRNAGKVRGPPEGMEKGQWSTGAINYRPNLLILAFAGREIPLLGLTRISVGYAAPISAFDVHGIEGKVSRSGPRCCAFSNRDLGKVMSGCKRRKLPCTNFQSTVDVHVHNGDWKSFAGGVVLKRSYSYRSLLEPRSPARGRVSDRVMPLTSFRHRGCWRDAAQNRTRRCPTTWGSDLSQQISLVAGYPCQSCVRKCEGDRGAIERTDLGG